MDDLSINDVRIWFQTLLAQRFKSDIHVDFNARKGIYSFKIGAINFHSKVRCFDYSTSANRDPNLQSTRIMGLDLWHPLHSKKSSSPINRKSKSCVVINFDLPLLMFSIAHELYATHLEKDVHGRWIVKHSNFFKCGAFSDPVIDYWIEYIYSCVVPVKRDFLESCKNSRVILSHDIDLLRKYRSPFLAYNIKLLVKEVLNFSPKKNWRNCKIIFKKSFSYDPYNSFKFLASVSEANNTKSLFFIMFGRKSYRWDGNYSHKSSDLKNLLSFINGSGHDIGIHFSYKCVDDPEQYARDLANAYSTLGEHLALPHISRMHYLRWDTLKSTHYLESCGILEDHTSYYSEFLGFKNGTSHSFSRYCFVNKRISKVQIVPTTLMDTSIYNPRDMSCNYKEILRKVKEHFKKVKKVNGIININWHNSELDVFWKRKLYVSIVRLAFE